MANPHKEKVRLEKQVAFEKETLAILLKGNLDYVAAIKHYRQVTSCDFTEAHAVVKRIERAHFATTSDPFYPRR